eukprot:SAG11_NODE_3620_length_2332_cov_2.379758_3_plen_319_part_01
MGDALPRRRRDAAAADGDAESAEVQRALHESMEVPVRAVPARPDAVERLARGTHGEEATSARSEGPTVCVICMGALAVGDEFTDMPCGHRFHSDCLRPWLRNTCPSCRRALPSAGARLVPAPAPAVPASGGAPRSWPPLPLATLAPAVVARRANCGAECPRQGRTCPTCWLRRLRGDFGFSPLLVPLLHDALRRAGTALPRRVRLRPDMGGALANATWARVLGDDYAPTSATVRRAAADAPAAAVRLAVGGMSNDGYIAPLDQEALLGGVDSAAAQYVAAAVWRARSRVTDAGGGGGGGDGGGAAGAEGPAAGAGAGVE